MRCPRGWWSAPSGQPADQLLREGLEPDRPRALDEERVARRDAPGDAPGRGLRVRRPAIRSVVARQLADPDQLVDAELASMCRGLAVVGGAVGTELCHPAEDGDPAAGVERCEMVERGAHRDRVRVVAVVHEHGAAGQLDHLAPQAREGYARGPTRHLGGIGVERHTDRDRACGVRDVVALRERKLEGRLAVRRADHGGGALTMALGTLHEDVAAGPEAERDEPVVQVGRERLRVGWDDRTSAFPQPGEDLGLGLGDRLDRAEELEVHGADVGDRADLGLRDRAELSDLAPAPHRHLEHEELALRRRREHGERQADLGIVVLGTCVGAKGKDRAGDVLHRRLPGRAGDSNHAAAELAPPCAGERLEGSQRIVDREHPAPWLGGGELAGPLPIDDGAPGAGRQGPRRVLTAIGPFPAKPEEELPAQEPARVDGPPLRPTGAALADDLRPRLLRNPLGRELDHAEAAVASARSSSRATSRSSNGIFRPCSNSCPCSWPLPAITTVSPRSARPRARAIAARRSGSTSTSATASPMPWRISSMIETGCSERGLSEVTTATSESRPAISPISGRLSRSRSPPQPKTQIRRPSGVIWRAEPSTLSSESGVWA